MPNPLRVQSGVRDPAQCSIDLAHFPDMQQCHDAVAANQRLSSMTDEECENMPGATQFQAR